MQKKKVKEKVYSTAKLFDAITRKLPIHTHLYIHGCVYFYIFT